MLGYLRDKWRTAQLQARYQRIVQEQVLELIEARGPQSVPEDPGSWTLLGGNKSVIDEPRRTSLRAQARRLVQTNPYARNLLRLLEVYVVGLGMAVSTIATTTNASSADWLQRCDQLWQQFLVGNRRHFSFVETARRTWRDGECFLRLFPTEQWPPAVRYVDPETIGPSPQFPDSEGLLRDRSDAEVVVGYQLVDGTSGDPLEVVPAAEMLHLKINVDSNESRGVTLFTSVLDSLANFDKWLETELQARKLQSSIVLWRKVQGSPTQVSAAADAAQGSTPPDPFGASRRERYRPGTILTTSHSTDLQFLSPNTNFGDAVPLGRLVLLGIAAGAGVPEYMLSSDASNANFASTMVAEGPAVKLFESEQNYFATELEALWRWVMRQGVLQGLVPEEILEVIGPRWSFPQLVSRDRAKERLADAQLIAAGVLSRAEVGRRDKVDPSLMATELADEAKRSAPGH